MLSILIPTYNFDCKALATELSRQITAMNICAEVIVMDDASPRKEFRLVNKTIDAIPHCRFIQLTENIGIARIRNRLADEARYDKLLFLDADVYPANTDFLHQYLAAGDDADVVCGGLLFRPEPPRPECTLRYKYGSRVEAQSAEQRMKTPYGEFRTLNFFISRKAFYGTRFDESFSRYGHEDTLFGTQLQENGYTITHIDNPVYHDVPDTNEDFLDKTRRSIDNLCEHRSVLQESVKLLRFYDKIDKWHLTHCIAFVFGILQPMLQKNLLGHNPSLFLLNIYKIGYLCNKMTKR